MSVICRLFPHNEFKDIHFVAKNNFSVCKLKPKTLHGYTKLCYTNQGSTAQKNHEHDKGFKPRMFNNLVASFSQVPPGFSSKLGSTTQTTRKVPSTAWKGESNWRESTWMWRHGQETSRDRTKSMVRVTAVLLLVFPVLPREKENWDTSSLICIVAPIYTQSR